MQLLTILTLIGFIETIPSRQIPVMDFEAFEPSLHQMNDTTYVVNFWASWCMPCREELPDLEKLHQTYQSEKVKVLLVSLDFPDDLELRLIPYLEKHDITAEVWLLDDPDFNTWINKVDPGWGGGIPVTLIYNRNSRFFLNRKTNFEELKSIVEPIL